MDKTYDVIVIGAGPAGVTAALYMCRGGLGVCVVHNGASALCKAERIGNYYGTGEISGGELYARGIEQLCGVGAFVVEAQATFASFDGEIFTVETTVGKFFSRRLVVATGAARLSVKIDGLDGLIGHGVSFCAVCDAFFCRGKTVAVIGAGEYAEHEYRTLAAVADKVCLLTNGETPIFSPTHGDVYNKRIAQVIGNTDGRLSGVVFEDGETLALDALFVAVGVLGSAGLAKSMGAFTGGNGAITVDERGMTNVPGLYAVGDCTAGIKQIARAVDDGMRAGLAILADLKENKND